MIYFTPLIGRWGNKLFQYCAARALAERDGATLATPPWEGENIFQLPEASRDWSDAKHIPGYGQNQKSVSLYTRKQAREWFKFRPEILKEIPDWASGRSPLLAHRRVGDYKNSPIGYVEVSKLSYYRSTEHFGFANLILEWITEETPGHCDFFNRLGAPFLLDFYRMTTADILFRGNSSFSWWAATLGEGRVFSPVINGLKGGKEEDVEFVEGNHPRISEIGDCTEMHLKEE